MYRRRLSAALAALLAGVGLTSVADRAMGAVPGTDVHYTLDADFDQGTLVDVHHDDPHHDQLQLSKVQTFFPFLNVAASGRGTVVRIHVETGEVVGEYRTAPAGRGGNPSRTTVDKVGNVWVANRAEDTGGRGSVARIGLVSGGTRVDAAGAPDPNGQYVQGPFAYNTCVDRDGDGLLRTSSGLGNVLQCTIAGGIDNDGGVDTAEDECLLSYTRVTGTRTRTVAVDSNNDVWVGGEDTDHEKLDGTTGAPVPGSQVTFGCGGYGGLVDKAGTLWSARLGTGLLRMDTATLAGACHGLGKGDYGLALDPNTGDIWHTFIDGNRVAKLAPNGTLRNIYTHGNEHAQGVAVDDNGNVWVAHSIFGGGATTVGHLRTDGTFVGNVKLPEGHGPTGVAIDANGKVWVTNLETNNAQRIDPNAGPVGGGGFPVGAVDMSVDLGDGADPYNYSDMTGAVLGEVTAPLGTWNVVQDSGIPDGTWRKITWNTEPQASEPSGTSITVEARAAESEADLPSASYVSVSNGTEFMLTGRFVEVRVSLRPSGDGTSPVLSDIRVEANLPPDCDEIGRAHV
jgi:streptogramin lyase